ncbi:MAG: hypothetical protein ACLGIO_05105 [Acidimicrobiia bacterium]
MDGDRLTDEETALVLRRAAELEQHRPDDAGGLDPATLEEAAVEVGLSRRSVRRALAELRAGALAPGPGTRRSPAARLFGPGTLAVSRRLAGAAPAVEAAVHAYLERQLFRVVRNVGGRSAWVQRDDLAAAVRRGIDRRVQKRLCLEDVAGVEVAVVDDPADDGDHCLVHLLLDVGPVRRASAALAVGGGAIGAAAVGGSLVLAGLDPVTAAAVPAGAAAALAGHRLGAAHHRRHRQAVETALHGMLDGLERTRPAAPRSVTRLDRAE